MAKGYDQKCSELAALFLGDEPQIFNDANIAALAQEIQDAIESFILDEKAKEFGL